MRTSTFRSNGCGKSPRQKRAWCAAFKLWDRVAAHRAEAPVTVGLGKTNAIKVTKPPPLSFARQKCNF
jgi:hypothetical protein